MKKFLRILLYVVATLYPIFVFTFLVILKSPVKIFSLCVMIFSMTFFLTFTSSKKKDGQKKTILDWRPLVSSILLLGTGLLCFFTNQILFLKLYSVAISIVLMAVFGSTLIFKPNIIFRFATLSDKSIIGSTAEKDVYKYCRNVTIIWCGFFLTNGTISTVTAFSENIFKISPDMANTVWSIYNGGISYLLLGLLFFIELHVRKSAYKKMVHYFSLSKFKSYSRPKEKILCYNENKKKQTKKIWKNFLTETFVLRNSFSYSAEEKFYVPTGDLWSFITVFTALLQTKKIPVIDFSFKENFAKPFNGGPEICLPKTSNANDKNPEADVDTLPEIDAGKSLIILIENDKSETVKLKDIEEKIDFLVEKEGKKLVCEKQPTSIPVDTPNEFLEKIILTFSLGLEFYREPSKK